MEGLAPLSDSFDFDFEANASSIHLAEYADVSEMELALPQLINLGTHMIQKMSW